MELATYQTVKTLGEVLLDARLRRGLTQEELGKDSGIGQAAVAKIERNRSVPKVTTLSRYLRALTLTPEEEFDVWHQIRGQVKQIDWAERLGLTSYDQAKTKAKARLYGGDSYDAYGYIETMMQFATNIEQRALAQMMHANRFKELGLFGLAEQSYNKATVTLGAAADSLVMSSILVNLADLHTEQGRYTLADAYIVYALQRELYPSTEAFAFVVKGRIKASFNNEAARVEAKEWFDKAFSAYGALEAKETGTAAQGWVKFHLAYLQATSSDVKVKGIGFVKLKRLASSFGPAENPINPEIYARVSLAFAEIKGDVMNLGTAQRLAKKHSLRGVSNRIKALKVALGAALIAMCVVLFNPGAAQALPKEGHSGDRVDAAASFGHKFMGGQGGMDLIEGLIEQAKNSDDLAWILSHWNDVSASSNSKEDSPESTELSDNEPEK